MNSVLGPVGITPQNTPTLPKYGGVPVQTGSISALAGATQTGNENLTIRALNTFPIPAPPQETIPPTRRVSSSHLSEPYRQNDANANSPGEISRDSDSTNTPVVNNSAANTPVPPQNSPVVAPQNQVGQTAANQMTQDGGHHSVDNPHGLT